MYKSFYYFFGILLFFFSNVFSQTIIKEKVNINPSLKINSPKYLAKSVLSVADEVTLPFDADLYVWDYIDGFVRMISPANKTIICPNGPVYGGTFPKGSIIELTTIITWNQQAVNLVFRPYDTSDSTYLLMFYSTDTVHAVGLLNIVPAKPKYLIKIENHAPWSIWPTLLPHGITRSEARTLSGYNPQRSFTISVTDGNGSPVQNAMVEITSAYQPGSGGHVHAGSNNVTPPQSLQGVFVQQGKQSTSLELTTSTKGIAVVSSYVASQIGGNYLITASLKSEPSVKDTVNLAVKVPGLVNFKSLIFDQKPYTFAQSNYGVENHPDNDWCTKAMSNSLYHAILDFYDWSKTPKGGGVPIIISLNDMSLSFGGLFDGVYANWHPPHNLHRIGRSVDINNTGPFQVYNPRHPSYADLTVKGRELDRCMRLHGGYRIPEGKSVHYEFYKDY